MADTELIAAAEAVIARWDSPKWKDEAPTADYIARLRRAVEASRAATKAAAPAAPTMLGVDWSTDYLTEQRAAMRDQAAELVEKASMGARRIDTARAIRQLDPRPVLTQGSIDRAKDALESFVRQVDPHQTLSHHAHAHQEAMRQAITTNIAFVRTTIGNPVDAAALESMRIEVLPLEDVTLSPTEAAKQLPLAGEREGNLAHRIHETKLATCQPHMGYLRAMCSCGWASEERDPYAPRAYAETRDDIARHHRQVEQERRK